MDKKNTKQSAAGSGGSSQNSQPTDRMDLFGSTTPNNTPDTKPTSRKNHSIYSGENRFISRLSRKRVVPLAILALLLIIGGVAFAIMRGSDRSDRSGQPPEQHESLTVSEDVLGDLPEILSGKIQNENGVTVNGPLKVNDSLTITPSSRPQNAQAGQIYFDSATRSFVFYDGTTFQTVSTAQGLAALQGMVTGQQTQNAAMIEDRIQTGIGIVIAQMRENQGVEFVELEAGTGIDITGNKVTNIGVTELQGTVNQVTVSGNTGNITISLPQDIHTGATPTFAGINLSSALGVNSGGTGTTAQDLLTGGVIYFDGDRFVSSQAPTQVGHCFVSGVNGPEFVPCGSLNFGGVSSINGLEGALTLANADASGTTITIHNASQTRAGLINTVSQRIAGLKTFTGGIAFSINSHISSEGNLHIQQASYGDLILGNTTGGRIILENLDCSAAGNGGKLTLDADGVVNCDADTGGDGVGVASVSASDASITVDNTDGNNPKISVNTRTGSGLVTTSGGIGLLDSCNDGQTLKYNSSTSSWECADDEDNQPTADCPTCVALQEETPGEAQEGHINISGTVISGGSRVNGPVLLKNLADTTEAFDLQNVSGDSLVRGNTENMTVTIGSLTSPSTSVPTGELPTGATNYLSTASFYVKDVAVSDDYSYIITDSSYLYVGDVSDPDSSPAQVFAGSMGSSLTNPEKVLANNDYLYVLDAVNSSYSALRVFDISDPSSPSIVLSLTDMNRSAVDMVKHGNYLYVVNRNSSSFSESIIYVYDISDPGSPTQVNTHAIPGSTVWPTSITAQGTHLFVTDRGTNELRSFDISDPENMSALSSVSTNSGPVDVSVRGDRAYVLNQSAVTLQTFDISDPENMSLLSTSEPNDIYPSPTAIYAGAGYLYVATYYNGGTNSHGYFQMFNTSNPDQPSPVGSVPLVSRAVSLTVKDGIAYVGAVYPGRNNMQVLRVGSDVVTLQIYGNTNISGALEVTGDTKAKNGEFTGNLTASSITSLGTIQGQSIDSVAVGGTLAIGSTKASAISLNQNTTLASGKSLTIGGSTSITTDSATALKVSDSNDNNLLLVDASGMNIDIGSTNAPTENTDVGGSLPDDGASGNVNISSLPNSVAVSGSYAYVASSIVQKLTIVNISQPSNPTVVGSVASGGDARDVAVEGDRVYLALNSGTVEVYDVSDPTDPSLLGSTSTQNAAASMQSIAVKNNYLFIGYIASATNSYGYIDTVDMTNPGGPVLKSVKTLGSNTAEVRLTIEGDRLYAISEGTTTNSGLRILNISNPAATSLPMTNHNMTGTKPSGGIAVKDGYAFIPFSNDSTLKTYDVSSISGSGALTPAASTPLTSSPSDTVRSESGKYLYITDQSGNTLQVLNITDPLAPQSLGTVDVSSGNSSAASVAVAAADGKAYVINNTRSNLVVVDLTGSEPRITLNQNTVLAEGRTLTTRGSTTVRTDSETAFRVQDADGNDVLVVDTENGKVIAGAAFAVGDDTGADFNCGLEETLNNITVVGGIITAGTCGDGSGEGGSQGPIQAADGVYTPSVDTIDEDGTLSIGSDNAGLIALNQNTEFAAGKTVTIKGDTSIAADSEEAFTVSSADSTEYIVVDTVNGKVTIGSPVPQPEEGGGESGGESGSMPEAPAGTVAMSGQPYDMVSRGHYLFISMNFDNKVAVYNTSDPASPSLVTELTLTKPERMSISGDYLYVLTDDRVYVVSISDPTSPSLAHTTNPFALFGQYEAIATNSTTLYIVTDQRQILSFNITNPLSAGLLSSRSNAINNPASAYAIANSGAHFFAPDGAANYLRVFTGTNSINPVGYTSTATKPTNIAIYGNYAYVVSSANNSAPGKMEVFDISTPTAPSKVAETATGNWPIQIKISEDGSYAAVVSYNSSDTQLIDISTPTAPELVGSAEVNSGPLTIATPPDQIAVASTSGKLLEVFNLNEESEPEPEPEPTFGITLNSNTISTEGTLVRLQGDTEIVTDSETAFSVQKADGTEILTVDTVNGNVLASGKITAGELEVSGAVSLAQLSVSGTATFAASIIVNGHIITGGDSPSAAALSALGSGASCSVSGNDTSGTITLTAGTGTSPGSVCDITFASAFDETPRPVISSAGQSGASLGAYAEISTTKLTIGLAEAPTESETYNFNYWNPQ